MITSAIEKDHLEWLKYVWAFGKNYKGIRRSEGSEKITFSEMFKIIKAHFSEKKDL